MPTIEIDKGLSAAIAAAKTKPHNFVIVAKGPEIVHLFVSKMPIKDAEVQKAKKEHGGNAIMRGKCQGEAGELVFLVRKDPTVQAKKLKEFITENTKLSVKPRFEVVTDDAALEEEAGEESAEETGATETEPVSEVQSPPAPDTRAAELTARLKAIKADIDTVRAAETSVTAEVKSVFAEVAALAGKKEFGEATQKLDALEVLVRKGLAELSTKPATSHQAPPSSPPKTPASPDLAIAFTNRFKAVKPDLDKVLAAQTSVTAEVKARSADLRTLAGSKQFAEASKVLDSLETLVKKGLAELAGKGATPQQAPPKATTSPDLVAAFNTRFKALRPEIDKALASKTPLGEQVKSHASEMSAAAKKGDFAEAVHMLDQIEQLLQGAPKEQQTGKEEPATDDEAFRKAWSAARSDLQAALDEVADQLADFGSALQESGEENLVWIAENGLSEVLSSLRDAANAVDRATSKTPAKVVAKAKPAIEGLKKQLKTPRVRVCDENKLGVAVKINETLGKAIRELEAALALVKA